MIKAYCGIRLLNGRAAEKKFHKRKHESIPKDDIIVSDEGAKADIELLKTILVNEVNMGLIKEKLIATKSYRLKMMEELDIDLLEMFPYFFTNPSLVMQPFLNII